MDKEMEVTKEKVMVLAKVGSQSLVGCHSKEYPMSFGNYFWFTNGLRCINMWSENLEEAAKRFDLKEVECTKFSHNDHSLGFVTDDRIPDDWLIQHKLCVTGCGWGTRSLCEACLLFSQLSTENHICGCETPDEAPEISMSYFCDNPVTRYMCVRCKRNWED